MNEQPLHPRDMSREQLVEFVSALQWAALDLAQHLSFVNELMAPNPDLMDANRKAAYMQAQAMAYALCGSEPPRFTSGGLTMLGATGLRIEEDPC